MLSQLVCSRSRPENTYLIAKSEIWPHFYFFIIISKTESGKHRSFFSDAWSFCRRHHPSFPDCVHEHGSDHYAKHQWFDATHRFLCASYCATPKSQKQLNWTFPRAFISSPAELGFNPTSLLPQPLKNVAHTQCFFKVFESEFDLSCMYKLFLKPGFL